jgi:2-polyprenyl-3-methyl-5-hydroxy-6-metoxy-1,4-benzoquinol methylase
MQINKETNQYNYFDADRSEMLKYIPLSAKTILDIGCANGVFATLVKKQLGITAWGIELNAEAAKIASQTLDYVISKDVFDALECLPKEHFDCIVFNDVLEHLIDPYTLLKLVKKLLTSNGVIVASIPNIRHAPILFDLVVNQNWNYTDWGVLDRTHLRFFTKKSIRKMFEEEGYTILKIDGINRSESFKGKFISKLLIGPFSDMKYIQFACLAKPNSY